VVYILVSEINLDVMSRKALIERLLRDKLAPLHLELVDESHMHSVPSGAESHFKLTVISDQFVGENLLARHRRVNGLLRDEFATGLHALALHAWTPAEWFEKGGQVPDSPPCLGGSKSN
jgi:BolA protein